MFIYLVMRVKSYKLCNFRLIHLYFYLHLYSVYINDPYTTNIFFKFYLFIFFLKISIIILSSQ